MSKVYPAQFVPEVLPAAEVLAAWGASGEELLYADPQLYAWLSAEHLVDGAGNYADHGPRGFGGLQPSVANQPPIFTNGTTGRKAWTFDNVTDYYIPLNFEMPVGAMTIAAVVDINSAVTLGDNQSHAIIAGSAAAAEQRPAALMVNRAFRVFNLSGGTTLTAAGAVSTPILALFSFDPLRNTAQVRINGGAWVGAAPVATGFWGQRETAWQIGAYVSTRTFKYYGHVYEAAILSTALSDPTEGTLLALVESVLKARHGIP